MKCFKTAIVECMIIMQLVYCVATVYMCYLMKIMNCEISVADIEIMMSSSISVGLLLSLCIIVITYKINENSKQLNRILRYGDKRKVFLEECVSSILADVALVIYQMISVHIWGYIMKIKYISWNSYNSYFYSKNNMVSDMSGLEFKLKFFIGFTLMLWFISILALICDWLFNRIISFMIIIFWWIAMLYLGNLNMFEWLRLNDNNICKSVVGNDIIGGISIICLIGLGTLFAKRKEFYSDI